MPDEVFTDFPDQPAPPDLGSQEGAASSSPSDGPSGRGAARGGAAPRISDIFDFAHENRLITARRLRAWNEWPVRYTSLELQRLFEREAAAGKPPRWEDTGRNQWPPQPSICTRCHGIFNTHPWKRDPRPDCERCGAGRWAESPAYRDWIAFDTEKGGRPARGLDQPWDELAVLARILVLPEKPKWLHGPCGRTKRGYGEKDGKRLLGELLAIDGGLNIEELARRSGFSESSLYNWRKVGENPTYTEKREGVVKAPTLDDRVTDHETRLAEIEQHLGLSAGVVEQAGTPPPVEIRHGDHGPYYVCLCSEVPHAPHWPKPLWRVPDAA